jgi:hypothetical protein
VLCLLGLVLGNGGDDGATENNGVLGRVNYGGMVAGDVVWPLPDAPVAQVDATQTPLSPLSGDAPGRQGVRETAGGETAESLDSLGGDGVARHGDSGDSGTVDAPRPLLATVSYSALGEIVAGYPWPINEAFAIVQCESRWDAAASSGISWGLWQINAIHAWRWPDFWSDWDDPEVNTQWAYELWQESGWGIWDCH